MSSKKQIKKSFTGKKSAASKVEKKPVASKSPVTKVSKVSKTVKKVAHRVGKAEETPVKASKKTLSPKEKPVEKGKKVKKVLGKSAKPVPAPEVGSLKVSAKRKIAGKPGKAQKSAGESLTVLLKDGAKLAKVAFFFEDLELDDHAPKKKVSPDAAEKPTASKRRRASVGEETTEEIYARVIAELQEANVRMLQEFSNQLCTRCCKNPVAPEFRVNKDLGYCKDCAEILHLGQTREARLLNYRQGLLGADSLDEGRDDDFGEVPSARELETSDSLLEDETL